MITKLKLKNWRSHLDSEIDFSTGTNALLGSMGSGKSSCMDGICFALFGTFPTLQSKKLKLDDVIMKKPMEKDKAEVEIVFALDGSNYSVKRIVEKSKGTTYSEVRQDGKLLEAPNSSRVTELLSKLLKVNYELFSKAIYSEQNGLDYFLTIPKGQRMKKIDELLMIDKFERARANAITLTNKVVERKLAIQQVIEGFDEEELQKSISELENSLNQIVIENINFQKSLDEISNKKTFVEKELLKIKNISESLDLLKREEMGISSTIDEIDSSIKIFQEELKGETRESIQKKYKDVKTTADDLERDFRNSRIKYEKTSSEFSQLQATINLEKENITKLEKSFEEKLRVKKDFEQYKTLIGIDIVRDMKEQKKLFEKLIADTEGLKVKIENLEQLCTQLSHAEGKCPICNSKLKKDKCDSLLKQKRNQIRALKIVLEDTIKNKENIEKNLKQLEEHEKILNEMQLNIKDFDAIQSELELSRKNFSELTAAKDDIEKQLKVLKSEIEKSEENLNKIKTEKQNLEFLISRFKEYEEKVNRIINLKKQHELLLTKIRNEEKILVEYDVKNLENEYKEFIAKQSEYQTKIINFEQLIKERNERIKEFKTKLTMISKYKNEVKKLDKLTQELKIFGKSLEETQIELRKDFVIAVNYSMNNLWQTLYPYQDFTGIRLNIEEGDYVLQVQSRTGEWFNVEGITSGGERSIAALTLRIAFALVLAPQLCWLVLDEPTHNLDIRAVEDLAETLRERIGEFVNQVFLITHDEKLQDAVTGNLYRLERDKANDGVTKVIQLN